MVSGRESGNCPRARARPDNQPPSAVLGFPDTGTRDPPGTQSRPRNAARGFDQSQDSLSKRSAKSRASPVRSKRIETGLQTGAPSLFPSRPATGHRRRPVEARQHRNALRKDPLQEHRSERRATADPAPALHHGIGSVAGFEDVTGPGNPVRANIVNRECRESNSTSGESMRCGLDSQTSARSHL